MNRNETRHKQRRTVLLSSLACLAILLSVYSYLLQHDIEAEKERCRYVAGNEANHIVTTIDCVMARTGTLKALVQDHGGDTSFFETVAEDVYGAVTEETGVALKNLAVAPGGVVSEVYPLAGNESLLGFDFMDVSRQGNLEAKEAYEKGRTVLTNPFELVQGGLGMAGRAPVILRDAGGGQRLWGLVTVTIDFDNLIHVLRLDNLSGMGMDYALSYVDADGGVHVMQSGGSPGAGAVKTRFDVRNLTWELAVEPSEGWMHPWRVVLSILTILIISGFAGAFANAVFQLKESNALLLRLSNTDRLTGCLNRRAYEDALAELKKRPPDEDFVYVSTDVNGLKQVNDGLGHLAGDELLCGASECLLNSLGELGSIYRIGGDEFVALLTADEAALAGALDALRATTDGWRGHCAEKLSISVGCAARRELPDALLDELVKTADARMYEAKREHYQKQGLDRRRSRTT